MALYLITGGAGFIGSHLADALIARGDQVRILDDLSTGKLENLPRGAEFIEGDVADAAMVGRAMRGVAGCFHLAAIASVARSNEDWLGTHRTNLTGTVTVLDAARAEGRKPVVYASSAAIYGNPASMPIAESTQARPLTAYGADKLGSELHAEIAWQVHGVPTFGCRFFNVYGPRQDPLSPYSGVISIFARRVASGEELTINGTGEQVRDFVYVADVVRHLLGGMALLRRAPQATVINVCTGRATSLLELLAALERVCGRAARRRFGPERQGDIRLSLGDPARATALLGTSATTRLDQGLAATLGLVDVAVAA
ncbi:MAG: NAD-dependent epimerase/dehydratase family protein [Roseococcus sp.]|nr:NAD-dependent epimerase/dehydratase family protein [Roseococcus sp.]